MQAETEGISIDDFDDGTLIPVEILPCDVTPRHRVADALSIVELGKQLLHSAKNGDTEMVRDLMCRGAPFTTDLHGTSALHFAAQNNHTETAEVLLRAGISRDARTKVDRTPLHMAAYEGHHEMAQLLLNYGAEVDSRDMLKMTPLHWSVEREHIEVMLVLLEHGADPNSISKFNKTPITLALEHDRLDLVDMLQQEREIINPQPTQLQSAEIEAATQNLMQIEAELQKEEQERLQLEEQQKRKLAQLASQKKQRMVFQQIRVQPVNEEEQIKEQLERLAENTIHIESNKKHKVQDIINSTGLDHPLRFLQAHGITMIPMDNDATIVENAMESGQTVVLTDAGKLALNLTRTNPINVKPVKKLQLASKKNSARKVITIRADQILGQNPQTMTSRGPNILKRTASDTKSAGKIFFTPVANVTTNIPTLTASKTMTSPVKKQYITPKTEPLLLQLDDGIGEIFHNDTPKVQSIMDVAELNRKLAEVRREAEEFRRQLQQKEEEAELYKQQLRNLTAQKAMMK